MKNYYSQNNIESSAILKNNSVNYKQIVFIDNQVKDYQYLAEGVLPGIEIVILQKDCNAIEQITEVIHQTFYSTIHIVAHGSPGCLYLGNIQLSLNTLSQYKSELKTWFSQSPHLPVSPSPSLLIYGCNVAAGDAGAEFIAKLHKITGAEIAASTTPIGNADLGGNWQLDVVTQEITNNLAFNRKTQQTYSGILATFTYDDDQTSSQSIPDNDTTGITRTFNVTDNLTITDVNIGINISHTYRSDLDITLQHPDGTTIELTTDNGGGNDNLYVSFDDEGSTNITADNAAHNTAGFTNIRIPEQALSAFDGKSSSGTWTLTIKDDADQDTGAINDSQLIIEANSIGDISGTVFYDYDSDGTQEIANDAAEVGAANITVTAYDSNGAVVDTATTDVNKTVRQDSTSSDLGRENPATDLHKQNSFSEVLVSPPPVSANTKRGIFSRAYSDPVNERTPLNSSSSETNSVASGGSTKNKMDYKSFTRAKSADDSKTVKRDNSIEEENQVEESKMKNRFKNLASFATLTKWWKKNVDYKRKKREKIEERKMRLKLQYHFKQLNFQ